MVDSRREADKIIFQMLGEHNQALKHIDKSMSDMSECFKQCQIETIRHEQEKMRATLKWTIRIGSMIASVFGMAIFFLLMGHPVIFQKFVDRFFK